MHAPVARLALFAITGEQEAAARGPRRPGYRYAEAESRIQKQQQEEQEQLEQQEQQLQEEQQHRQRPLHQPGQGAEQLPRQPPPLLWQHVQQQHPLQQPLLPPWQQPGPPGATGPQGRSPLDRKLMHPADRTGSPAPRLGEDGCYRHILEERIDLEEADIIAAADPGRQKDVYGLSPLGAFASGADGVRRPRGEEHRGDVRGTPDLTSSVTASAPAGGAGEQQPPRWRHGGSLGGSATRIGRRANGAPRPAMLATLSPKALAAKSVPRRRPAAATLHSA